MDIYHGRAYYSHKFNLSKVILNKSTLNFITTISSSDNANTINTYAHYVTKSYLEFIYN